jgi:hypothetical protein
LGFKENFLLSIEKEEELLEYLKEIKFYSIDANNLFQNKA